MINPNDLRLINDLKATTVKLNRVSQKMVQEYFDRVVSDTEKNDIKTKIASIDLTTIKASYLNQRSTYYSSSNQVLVAGRSDQYSAKSFSNTKVKNHEILGPIKKDIETKLQAAYGGNAKVSFKLLYTRDRSIVVKTPWGGNTYASVPTGIALYITGNVNASLEQIVAKKQRAAGWKSEVKSRIAAQQELLDELLKISPDEV